MDLLESATKIGTVQKDPFMSMDEFVKRENKSGLLVRANIDDGTEVTFRDVDEEKREVEFVISSYRRDSYGTRFDPKGMDLTQYRRNPQVLYRHMRDGGIYTLPIANGIPETSFVDGEGQIHMRARFTSEETFPFGFQIYKLIRDKFLHMSSIGAQVMDHKMIEEDDGTETAVFTNWKLFEFSVVPIGANDDALVVSRDLEDNVDIDRARKVYASIKKDDDEESDEEKAHKKKKKPKGTVKYDADREDTVRWNRDLSDSFDVSEVELEPSRALYDLVSKHLESKVKDVFHNSVFIPSARIGSFLRALKLHGAKHDIEDVRNINSQGGESPPVYEMIQLNSKERDDFLIDGIVFYRSDGRRFSTRIAPTWGGMQMDVFTRIDDKEFNRDFVDDVWKESVENNPLKGEAFSLSGSFIRKSGETWDDVILADRNKETMMKNCDRLSKKRESCPNRGVMFMGKPGTGKTMAGRIIRNTTDATFIWMSARDFWRGGAAMALSEVFALSRELAPSVVFMEDIDHWLSGTIVDFLKTELDGIMRRSGVMTILTTNYPERLPDALLDRPGRFHDILHIDLPDKKAREKMAHRWIEGVSDDDVKRILDSTAGYSGAHMYELAQFIKNLREADEIGLKEAIRQALEKLDEQRKLISDVKKGTSYGRETDEQFKHRDYFEKYSKVSLLYRKLMQKLYRRMGLVCPDDEVVAVQRITDLVLSSTSKEKIPPKTPVAREFTPEELRTLTVQLTEKVKAKERVALSSGVPLRTIRESIPKWTEEALSSISVTPH